MPHLGNCYRVIAKDNNREQLNERNNTSLNINIVLSPFVCKINNHFSNESFISFISPINALFEAFTISIDRVDNPLAR